MAEYTWAFDKSFLVFLGIAFLSMTIATKIRSIIPMPLIYGVIFIIGFATGILPKDMLLSANMIAVGTIAYNVLVVHSGTMINFRMLRAKKKETLLSLVSLAVLAVVGTLVLIPLIGKKLALLALGSIVGGGASCAIASRAVFAEHPELAVFPWLIFMLQGVFSVPIVTWALKRESKELLDKFRTGTTGAASQGTPGFGDPGAGAPQTAGGKKPLCMRIPDQYKTTPYYLGSIMIVTVLNNLLQSTVLANVPINSYITALLFGIVLGALGFLDRAPLFKSDSYGLLILGLMGLMANTLANTPWFAIVAYIPALLISFVVGSVLLLLCAFIGSKVLGISRYRAIALLMNCMMGFPVNDMLINQAAAIGGTEAEKGYLKSEVGALLGIGTSLISNGLSVLVVGILTLFV